MSLDSYANLKQEIEKFSHRTDISDRIDTFIDLCESRINTRLKLRSNERRERATVSGRFLALPDRFLQMRRLSLISGGRAYELKSSSPEAMTIRPDSGRPQYFVITSQIEFDRPTDTDYTVEMSFYSSLTPLSDSNTTNNVLTDYPDLYLYGSLAELHRWSKDQSEAGYCDAIFEQKLIDTQKRENRGRYGPAPAMRSEGVTP